MTGHWQKALEMAAGWCIFMSIWDVLRTRQPIRQYLRDGWTLGLTALTGILFGLVMEFDWGVLQLPVLPVTLLAILGSVTIVVLARKRNSCSPIRHSD